MNPQVEELLLSLLISQTGRIFKNYGCLKNWHDLFRPRFVPFDSLKINIFSKILKLEQSLKIDVIQKNKNVKEIKVQFGRTRFLIFKTLDSR